MYFRISALKSKIRRLQIHESGPYYQLALDFMALIYFHVRDRTICTITNMKINQSQPKLPDQSFSVQI